MTDDLDTSPGVIARRPSVRHMNHAAHLEALRVAQLEYLDAEAAYNAAIHKRGRVAHVAKLAGCTWPEIGEQYGGIVANSAQMLVKRYLKAVAQGKTFALPTPRTRRRTA